nr:2102_t:CDS:10 [Entrophospora candida]
MNITILFNRRLFILKINRVNITNSIIAINSHNGRAHTTQTNRIKTNNNINTRVSNINTNNSKSVTKSLLSLPLPPVSSSLSNDVYQRFRSREMLRWTQEETDLLEKAVVKHGTEWELISVEYFNCKKDTATLSRKWNYIRKNKSLLYYDRWTEEEDKKLKMLTKKHGTNNWSKIVEQFNNTRNLLQIKRRWEQLAWKKKGKWLPEEHAMLTLLVEQYGFKWNAFSRALGRPPGTLRLYYDYAIANPPWTKVENDQLYQAVKDHGEDWDKIKELFPYRSKNNLKYHYDRSISVNPSIKKGIWSEEEIKALEISYSKHGKKWRLVSADVGTRSSIQCRLRFKALTRDSISASLLNNHTFPSALSTTTTVTVTAVATSPYQSSPTTTDIHGQSSSSQQQELPLQQVHELSSSPLLKKEQEGQEKMHYHSPQNDDDHQKFPQRDRFQQQFNTTNSHISYEETSNNTNDDDLLQFIINPCLFNIEDGKNGGNDIMSTHHHTNYYNSYINNENIYANGIDINNNNEINIVGSLDIDDNNSFGINKTIHNHTFDQFLEHPTKHDLMKFQQQQNSSSSNSVDIFHLIENDDLKNDLINLSSPSSSLTLQPRSLLLTSQLSPSSSTTTIIANNDSLSERANQFSEKRPLISTISYNDDGVDDDSTTTTYPYLLRTIPSNSQINDDNNDNSSAAASILYREQTKSIKKETNLTTPVLMWVRYSGHEKEGYCDNCEPDKWLQLKNISGKMFISPVEIRKFDSPGKRTEGLCHQCNQWVTISTSQEELDNMMRKLEILEEMNAQFEGGKVRLEDNENELITENSKLKAYSIKLKADNKKLKKYKKTVDYNYGVLDSINSQLMRDNAKLERQCKMLEKLDRFEKSLVEQSEIGKDQDIQIKKLNFLLNKERDNNKINVKKVNKYLNIIQDLNKDKEDLKNLREIEQLEQFKQTIKCKSKG